MSLREITAYEMQSLGVASLPTRPTSPREFGGRGFTPAEMKAAFDRLPRLVAERYNELVAHISDGTYLSDISYEGEVTLRDHLVEMSARMASCEGETAALSDAQTSDEARFASHDAMLESHGSALTEQQGLLSLHEGCLSSLCEEVAFTRILLFGGLLTRVELSDAYGIRQTAAGLPAVSDVETTVSRISGSTAKSENLIPIWSETATFPTITAVGNGDGTITVNGTPPEGTYKSFNFSRAEILPGKTYTLTGCPQGGGWSTYVLYVSLRDITGQALQPISGTVADFGNGATFTAPESASYAFVQARVSITVDNLVFFPMLAEGTEQKPFVTNYGGLKSAAFRGIVSTGRNLIPPTFPSSSMNGMTFTVSEDGSITINGTSTATDRFNYTIARAEDLHLEEGKTYWFSGKTSEGESTGVNLNIFDGENYIATYGDGVSVTIGNAKTAFIYIVASVGATARNAVFKPMLSYGANPPEEYEAYQEDASFALDSSVSLAQYDYIDIPAQRLVQQTEVVTFDGSESWGIAEIDGAGYIVLADALPGGLDAVSNLYTFAGAGNGVLPQKEGEFTLFNGIVIKDSRYQELSDWTAHLVDLVKRGNPLSFAYRKATATEFDISVPRGYVVSNGGSERMEQGSAESTTSGVHCTVTQEYYTIAAQGVMA